MPAWRLLMLGALCGVQLRWMRRVRYIGPASLVETADHPQSVAVAGVRDVLAGTGRIDHPAKQSAQVIVEAPGWAALSA